MHLGAGSDVEDGIVAENEGVNEGIETGSVSKAYNIGVYSGEFKGGRRHGVGKMEYNGVGYLFPELYEGAWENDEIQGGGSMTYNDGSKYEGFWERGKRQGHGKMKDKNGDLYNGSWADDVKLGEGSMSFENKNHYEET